MLRLRGVCYPRLPGNRDFLLVEHQAKAPEVRRRAWKRGSAARSENKLERVLKELEGLKTEKKSQESKDSSSRVPRRGRTGTPVIL